MKCHSFVDPYKKGVYYNLEICQKFFMYLYMYKGWFASVERIFLLGGITNEFLKPAIPNSESK